LYGSTSTVSRTDPGTITRASQARRLIVYQALRNGAYYPWDFQPLQKASERYMRNHMDLNVLETNQRFPRGE
jgi:choline-sulfatase